MFYCTKCVTPSTRPRIQFDENGVCNACNWHERKQTEIDWFKKKREFEIILDKFRDPFKFDCIVPCSGGKDSSYVAWKLKHEFAMNPLCITFKPQLQTWLGRQNLENFQASGFNHILITPDTDQYKKFARESFINDGMPKQPFVTGISTALLQYAAKFDIKLVVYGEQGEVEYGGTKETETLKRFDHDFLKNIYYEGQDPSEYGPWWQMPSESDLNNVYATWWSLFEDWDSEHNARFAKEKCGLQMMVGGSIGTFTNYSQLDDILQDLHCYLMFVKYGFGRCTSDASIEIRRGRMTRDEGLKVVQKLDGQFPVEYLDVYLDYFEMTEKEFWQVIDSHVNKELLAKTGNAVMPYDLKF